MQQLYFEPAWDRTISEEDRQWIINLFSAQDHTTDEKLLCTYVRHATNHRGELLYTVILHNYRDSPYSFIDEKVTLLDLTGNFTSGIFTLPVDIPSYTSMPWTFIFTDADAVIVSDASLVL